jgi:hypothetical protein
MLGSQNHIQGWSLCRAPASGSDNHIHHPEVILQSGPQRSSNYFQETNGWLGYIRTLYEQKMPVRSDGRMTILLAGSSVGFWAAVL